MRKRPTLEHLVNSRWFKTRPKAVQEKVFHYPPGLYWLKETGQKVLLHAYSQNENGACDTCRVLVLKEHNPSCTFDREVFGVSFDSLKPADTL